MKFASVCSGIEAASVAWEPLGWKCAWVSEIEKFPCSVLQHHYPKVPNLGDMTKILDAKGRYRGPEIDLLVGGTPCQAFSVAGLRGGLKDARGNLSLEFCRIARAIRPRFVVWENVPGVLNHKDNPFGCILAGLAGADAPLCAPVEGWENAGVVAGPVYGMAWRVLDAQYFGVPQRRERVFIVGCLGDWRRAAKILFEPQSLRGDTASGRKSVERNPGSVAKCLNAGGQGRKDWESENLIPHTCHTLKGEGYDASEDGTGRGVPIIPVLEAGAQHAIYDMSGNCDKVLQGMSVRRLLPVECERLQGFPDNWTLVPHRNKPACDGPRYKSIGNSMAVPVMRWIGERIQGLKDFQPLYRIPQE